MSKKLSELLKEVPIPRTALRNKPLEPVAALYSNVFCMSDCSAMLSDVPINVHDAGGPALPLTNPPTLFSYKPSELDFYELYSKL